MVVMRNRAKQGKYYKLLQGSKTYLIPFLLIIGGFIIALQFGFWIGNRMAASDIDNSISEISKEVVMNDDLLIHLDKQMEDSNLPPRRTLGGRRERRRLYDAIGI